MTLSSSTPTKLTKKQVAPILAATFPEYTGRKIDVVFTESTTIWDTNWDGGTHTDYRLINLENSETLAVPDNFTPWDNPIEGKRIAIPVNGLVVTHRWFCGKEMGIRIYAHPSRQPQMLAAAN